MNDLIEGFLGKSVDGKSSKMPAKLDYIQSATGLFLGLFMWAHMLFVSTILVSQEFYLATVHFLEGSFIFGKPVSQITTVIVGAVFVIFIVHAGTAMRKLPINFRQWQAYRTHMKMMKHDETSMWFIQAFTGFVMFFLGSAHLFMMMSQSGEIGPGFSADRVWSDFMWPFYVMLLIAVELHGTIGLYRLCIKWGWFEGKNSKESRAKLKKAKWAITVFFMTLGIITLLAYMKVGYERTQGEHQQFQGKTIHLEKAKH